MKFRVLPPLAAGALLLFACNGNIQGPPEEGDPGSGATASSSGTPGSGGASGSTNATGGKGSNGKGGSGSSSGGSNGSAGSNSGAGTGSGSPSAAFGTFTRLTQAEYRSTVLEALGVEPELSVIPVDGRIGQYTSNASVTPDPVHPYLLAAEDLAESLIPGELPACEAGDAEQCLQDDYADALGALFRRPVTAGEISAWATMIGTLTTGGASATDATRAVLVSALLSPDFLFRASPVASDATSSARRLAETLSYALWDAPPDAELAAVADATPAELPTLLAAQAARLGADAKATPVVARFLSQWLRVDTDLRLAEPDFATSPRYLELLAYAADALETTRRCVTSSPARAASCTRTTSTPTGSTP